MPQKETDQLQFRSTFSPPLFRSSQSPQFARTKMAAGMRQRCGHPSKTSHMSSRGGNKRHQRLSLVRCLYTQKTSSTRVHNAVKLNFRIQQSAPLLCYTCQRAISSHTSPAKPQIRLERRGKGNAHVISLPQGSTPRLPRGICWEIQGDGIGSLLLGRGKFKNQWIGWAQYCPV